MWVDRKRKAAKNFTVGLRKRHEEEKEQEQEQEQEQEEEEEEEELFWSEHNEQI